MTDIGRKVDGYNWAESRQSASARRSMNSCRLGRSEPLAVAANISAISAIRLVTWKLSLSVRGINAGQGQ